MTTKLSHRRLRDGTGRRQTGTPSQRPSKRPPKRRKRSGHNSTSKEDMKTRKAPLSTSPGPSKLLRPYTYHKRQQLSDPNRGGMERCTRSGRSCSQDGESGKFRERTTPK